MVCTGEQLRVVNDRIAAQNRARFTERGPVVLHMLGSAGAGKTALLEAIARRTRGLLRMGIVHDQRATRRDQARTRAAGAVVHRLVGAAGHVDALHVHHALGQLPLEDIDLLAIENSGDTPGAAVFDLGEHRCVLVTSVLDGTDYPRRHAALFASADLVVLNKIDVLPRAQFDLAAWRQAVREVNPRARVVVTSTLSGAGVDEWTRALIRLGPPLRHPAPADPA